MYLFQQGPRSSYPVLQRYERVVIIILSFLDDFFYALGPGRSQLFANMGGHV